MKRRKNNRGGFTLVEIIVTFALTALFISSATLVLSTFLKSHAVASAVATEQNVASVIMETITGELSAARYSKEQTFGNAGLQAAVDDESISGPGVDIFPQAMLEGKTEEETKAYGDCKIMIDNTKGSSEVWYISGESGNVVRMYLKEKDGANYLAMDYYVKPEGKEAPEETPWSMTPWQLGESVYHRCSIKTFQVTRDEPADAAEHNSSLTVRLVLQNALAGEDNTYTMERSLDCYNLAPKEIMVYPEPVSEP